MQDTPTQVARMRSVILDAITVCVVVGAVWVTVSSLRSQRSAVLDVSGQTRQVPDWKEVAKSGQRRGAASPVVTVVEFGDYECPACRGFENAVEGVLAKFPSEVAVVYRHWPLNYHSSAMPAAVAAECAGEQLMFAQFHRELMGSTDWKPATPSHFVRLAKRVGVRDLEGFERCLMIPELNENIARDVAAVKKLNGRGTPTLIVNDSLMAGLPDSVSFERLIEDRIALARKR